MTGKLKNRAAYYRQRAVEARAESAEVQDEVVSAGMRQIAELWERIADHADQKDASRSG